MAILQKNDLSRATRIKLAVRRYLRAVGLLTDHTTSPCDSQNIGDTNCRDERCLIEEINHTIELQQRNPLVNSLYGGGMRFSHHCGVPIAWYREHVAPLYCPGLSVTDKQICQWDREELDASIRGIIKGIVVRGSRLYKLGVHGPHCGWAEILGYGLIHQLWLVADGCRALEDRAVRCNWGPFRVYGTYHEHYRSEAGREWHRTYAIRRNHSLLRTHPLTEIMTMSDEEFLRCAAMDWLREDDPDLATEIQTA